MKVYKLVGARQANYGIATASPTQWITIRESFGDYGLSVEAGRRDHRSFFVSALPDDASEELQFNVLATLEELGRTWAEQQAIYTLFSLEETAEDDGVTL